MKTPKMTFAAAGDFLATRLVPMDCEGFPEITEYLSKADARFFNLETTLHRGGIPGNQFAGGSNHRSDPKVLKLAEGFGFNMTSFANNHTFDYGYEGLEATLQELDATDIVHTGVGRNLDEAAAPVYLDTKNGRVALVCMTASFCNIASMAGRQSRRVPGRPGLNPLRVKEWIELPPEQFAVLKQISEESGVNADIAIARAEGYVTSSVSDVEVTFGHHPLKYTLGNKAQYHTMCNMDDLNRLEASIQQAKSQADYVLVSIHAHQVGGTAKESVPEFLQEFAHTAIDAGACAVIGHGPHLLRPIEIFEGRPIFYSLGDFVIHNENFDYMPEDYYNLYGLTSDAPMNELYRRRSKDYTRGLLTDRRMLESVIPRFEMEDGKLTKLELYPIEMNFDQPRYRTGNPRFSADHGIIERLAEMSKPYGTTITVNEQGMGIVELP
jgi:poly-gamma-glutamate synthesis protein (capsule biosynthesis protein)